MVATLESTRVHRPDTEIVAGQRVVPTDGKLRGSGIRAGEGHGHWNYGQLDDESDHKEQNRYNVLNSQAERPVPWKAF